MDIEGAESDTLKGAERSLVTDRPQLLIELHTPEQDVLVGSCLRNAGYTARRITPNTPELTDMTVGWPTPHGIWGQIVATSISPV